MPPKLSIVIPAYNEEKRILPTLQEYYSLFRKLGRDFEIIVIPNNCDDKTFEIVRAFAKGKPEVSSFVIEKYSGKGGAVLKGFELAKGDFIGFTDADGSTNAGEFLRLFENLLPADGIIGSRRMKGSKICPKRLRLKNFNSAFFNLLERIFVGLNFKDTQCGGKIFSKKLSQLFLKKGTERGWIFDLDFLYLANKNGFSIKEFPILWKESDGTKLTFAEKIKSFFEVIIYGFRGPRKAWAQFFIFSLMGVVATLIHLGILYFLTAFLKVYYILSSAFGFLVANVFSFATNSKYTFRRKIEPKKRYHKFLLVSLASMGINLLALYFFTEFVGIYYLFSQILATFFSLGINFFGNKCWTFQNEKRN